MTDTITMSQGEFEREWYLRSDALEVIAEMPLPEQDNMLSANMRKVARDALTPNADSASK